MYKIETFFKEMRDPISILWKGMRITGIRDSTLLKLTRILSTCSGLRLGSNKRPEGSTLTGDCLLPLLHKLHSRFNNPQKSGPERKEKSFL